MNYLSQLMNIGTWVLRTSPSCTVNVYDLAISVSLNFIVHGFLSRQDDHQAILQNYVHENQSLNSGVLIWLSSLCIYVHIQHQSKKIVCYLFDSHAWDREG